MSTNTDNNPSSHRCSIPSHIAWRSILGTVGCWSGSKSNGAVLDFNAFNRKDKENTSLIRHVPSDKRMYHLPCSLRDRLVDLNLMYDCRIHSTNHQDDSHEAGNHTNKRALRKKERSNKLQLLSHPRIVNAIPQSGRRYTSSEGIACMALDRGYNESQPDSPSRYLLVGSGGSDCSISLYDLSYFGSDDCLYQQSRSLKTLTQNTPPLPAVTHRPVARSVRHNEESIEETVNVGGVPSGHRQPLLGAHWYPADHGSFVSTSISGEILVWDAESFVPVYGTTTHVYSGHSSVSEVHKSVAPLQCVDLPKSPNACPHGRALLALGLGGGDGRSVIQLCDAFSGGCATHELVGHNGGVNSVAWDPNHPFRLASGGEDGTVRLWDIRKAGHNACLGVLDRNHGYSDVGASSEIHPMKRQRISLRDNRRLEGIESHGGPVAALAFAPGGDDLASIGYDGGIHLWDIRPDSCYASSIAAMIGKRKYDADRGGMESSVACGGRLYPYTFGLDQKRPSHIYKMQKSWRDKSFSLAIIQDGSRSTTTLFATGSNIYSKGQIAAYSLSMQQEMTKQSDVILHGHLDDVTCLTPVAGAWDNLGLGCCRDQNNTRLLSSGKDGIILSWGVSSTGDTSSQNDNTDDSFTNRSRIFSLLKQQRQHRIRRLNRQYQAGLISGRAWRGSVHDENYASADTETVDHDSW